MNPAAERQAEIVHACEGVFREISPSLAAIRKRLTGSRVSLKVGKYTKNPARVAAVSFKLEESGLTVRVFPVIERLPPQSGTINNQHADARRWYTLNIEADLV